MIENINLNLYTQECNIRYIYGIAKINSIMTVNMCRYEMSGNNDNSNNNNNR